MDSKLRTPNSELRTIFQGKNPLEEILLRLTLDGVPSSPKKILFQGEGAGGIASYVAGWMAGRGMNVIVLDGANRFNPYTVSSFARKALISPEESLKRVRIARAFTCYQMATLMGERLPSLLREERATVPTKKPWVILLGPITTFWDEDVSEREARSLFERALSGAEKMAETGVPFFLFQSPVSPSSKRVSLMKRLSQFSDLVWSVCLEDGGPQVFLEKSLTVNISLNPKHEIRNSKQILMIKAQNSELIPKNVLEI